MARRVSSALRGVGAAMLLSVPLSGCMADLSADDYELRNMNPDNIVPKSSPKAFVAAFESFCLEPQSRASARAKLRASDYVPAPRKLGAMEVWVVDDRRPAVLLNDTDCAVLAESRTGQTGRVNALVGDRFPEATPVTDSRFESLWQVDGADRRTLIFTRRIQPNQPQSQFMLGISLGS